MILILGSFCHGLVSWKKIIAARSESLVAISEGERGFFRRLAGWFVEGNDQTWRFLLICSVSGSRI